jgi:hypothetical protein
MGIMLGHDCLPRNFVVGKLNLRKGTIESQVCCKMSCALDSADNGLTLSDMLSVAYILTPEN